MFGKVDTEAEHALAASAASHPEGVPRRGLVFSEPGALAAAASGVRASVLPLGEEANVPQQQAILSRKLATAPSDGC